MQQSQGVAIISVLQVREREMMDILSNKNILSGTEDVIICRKQADSL